MFNDPNLAPDAMRLLLWYSTCGIQLAVFNPASNRAGFELP